MRCRDRQRRVLVVEHAGRSVTHRCGAECRGKLLPETDGDLHHFGRVGVMIFFRGGTTTRKFIRADGACSSSRCTIEDLGQGRRCRSEMLTPKLIRVLLSVVLQTASAIDAHPQQQVRQAVVAQATAITGKWVVHASSMARLEAATVFHVVCRGAGAAELPGTHPTTSDSRVSERVGGRRRARNTAGQLLIPVRFCGYLGSATQLVFPVDACSATTSSSRSAGIGGGWRHRRARQRCVGRALSKGGRKKLVGGPMACQRLAVGVGAAVMGEA